LRMVSLRRDTKGNFSARKRLPNDVREEYGRRHGQRFEAKFFASANKGAAEAKRLFREWEDEVDAHIEIIRSERTGKGIALTPRQTRALAGEWYEWFLARHPVSDEVKWKALRDQVHDALREAAGDDAWERSDPDALWREDAELRRAVRPVLADIGETAQFLALKRLVLNEDARQRFLDWLYEDLAAALRRLIRTARGDYRDDNYAERFPKFDGTDSGETPQQLFDRWVAEKQPAWNTEVGWKGVFKAMTKHFQERSAASITPEEAQQWVTGLIGPKRSARTVDNNYISASRTVFGWAVEHKHIARNPFATVKVTIPRLVKLREKSLRPDEQRLILAAALGIAASDTGDAAARRWVPWLCAYTGARPGEITQLRGNDVVEENGIPAIRIAPEAGSVKGREPRVVPLHEHLIEQGFLQFVAQRGAGPLFYNPNGRSNKGPAQSRKPPRSLLARQRLAHWVRSLGIIEKGLSPLHAWRHTFKRLAARKGIEAGMRDAICGHSPRTVADEYETPTLEDMAEALKKFPRYEV
jgi:integrase